MKPPNLPGEESINEDEDEDERQKVATLPDDLIFINILPRLPVKPLLRFKSVCKNWRSSISSPEFSKSHLTFSRSRHQFLLPRNNAIVESSNFCLVRNGFEIGDGYDRIEIAGCCNGLICFYPRSSRLELGPAKFYVLNPATGQQVQILGPCDDSLKDCYKWFGHISSIDDYKIVSFNRRNGKFWIFSWKGGIWKRISWRADNVEHGAYFRMESDEPVLVDDILYWPLNVYQIYTNVGTQIFEFNLVSEECLLKPRMQFADWDEPAILVNLKGCLALHTTCGSCITVWMLRHRGDWNSWVKVDSKNLGGAFLICYSTTGKLVVAYKNLLKVVDDLSQLPPHGEESSELEKFLLQPVPSLPYTGDVRDYVESLISLV